MSRPIPENIKKRIRELHEKERLSIPRLSERFSISQTTITHILGPAYDRKKTADLPTKEEMKSANIPASVPAPYNFGARPSYIRGEKGRFKGRAKADPV